MREGWAGLSIAGAHLPLVAARNFLHVRGARDRGLLLVTMHERYIRWWTPHLSRDFEMLVFGDGGGLPLMLFPTSYGRY